MSVQQDPRRESTKRNISDMGHYNVAIPPPSLPLCKPSEFDSENLENFDFDSFLHVTVDQKEKNGSKEVVNEEVNNDENDENSIEDNRKEKSRVDDDKDNKDDQGEGDTINRKKDSVDSQTGGDEDVIPGDSDEDEYEEESLDPLADLDARLDEDAGEICELHVYENRYNSRGEYMSFQVGATESMRFDIGRSRDAALVLTRDFNSQRVLRTITLQINSPYMKTALQKVVKSYPGVSLDTTGPLKIQDDPRCIFHYRNELAAYAEASDDEDIKEHVDFLLKFMRKSMRQEIGSYETLMEGSETEPGLEFENLWMAFRPGDILYQQVDGEDTACRLHSMIFFKFEEGGLLPSKDYMRWDLKVERIECDGDNFGYTSSVVKIKHYDGYRSLSDLDIFPIQYHAEREKIESKLVTRGHQFLALVGIHYRFYKGVMELLGDITPPYGMPSYPSSKSSGISATSMYIPTHERIIVDCKEFRLNVRPGAIDFVPGTKVVDGTKGEHLRLRDAEILVCTHKIPGFSLVAKRWGYFKVSDIERIEFNHTAFDGLVLPGYQKDLIRSLVKEHQSKQSGFDDLIKGKGKGLIFLLHGEPGVGKTLTAESIADLTLRPLYVLGCGDLGTGGLGVEQKLKRTMDLASKWDALVLIDEADVFMEERNSRDLQRNELVSVLLRVLEYFEGIMFLTTNRIETIDTAFKSRIHLSLYYPRLSIDARRSIWKSFIARGSGPDQSVWLDNEFLDGVASHDINGRQIKNVLRVACSIAANDDRVLTPDDIVKVLEASQSFESRFGSVTSPQSSLQRVSHNSNVYGRACGRFIPEMVPKLTWLTHILMLMGSVAATKWLWIGLSSVSHWWRSHGTSK